MNDVEQPNAKPLMLRPWVPWLLGAALVIAVWAFVDNLTDRDWVLAGCFGAITLGFIVQIIGLLWIRRANRHPGEGGADAHRLRARGTLEGPRRAERPARSASRVPRTSGFAANSARQVAVSRHGA